MLVDNVKIKFDSSNVEFVSSGVESVAGEYSTKQFINLCRASFGVKMSVEVEDETIYFAENLVTNYTRLNERNLVYCKYINLRHSSISSVELEFLLSLQYIDIAFSAIRSIDLLSCSSLHKVIDD